MSGCVPRLIDDDAWAEIQRRRAFERDKKQTGEEIVAKLKRALQRSPLLGVRELGLQGLPNIITVRRRLGPWAEALKQAGLDLAELRRQIAERGRQRQADGFEFGCAIADRLKEDGHRVSFSGRSRVLVFPEFKVRPRLLWPTHGENWPILADPIREDRVERVDFDLLVRMEDGFLPKDFFVVPPADVVVRFPHWLKERLPRHLARYRCRTPQQLLARIRSLNEHAARRCLGVAVSTPRRVQFEQLHAHRRHGCVDRSRASQRHSSSRCLRHRSAGNAQTNFGVAVRQMLHQICLRP